MVEDQSFGIIPLSKEGGQWKVFLIQHRKGGYWGFPKGHAEKGETPQEAALRELKEETHLDVDRWLHKEPFVEKYHFTIEGRRVSKQVCYFAAQVSGNVKLQAIEIEDGIWVGLQKGLEKITHTEGREILTQVISILNRIK